MFDSFTSLSFLRKDCSERRACRKEALAERRSALAASIAAGEGLLETTVSRALLHLRTHLSFLRITGDILGLRDFEEERLMDLFVEFAAYTRSE